MLIVGFLGVRDPGGMPTNNARSEMKISRRGKWKTVGDSLFIFLLFTYFLEFGREGSPLT